MKKPIFLLAFLLASTGWSATVTISNTGGNWSSTGAWVGAATPAVTDDVVATGSSGPITIDTTTDTCKSLILTGYTNVMNFDSGQVLTVAGGVTFASGQTLSGTGNLTISAAATLLSNSLVFPGSVSFTVATTKTLGDNWTVSGNFGTANAQTINGNTMNVGGNFIITNNTTGTTTFNINGNGSINSSGAGTGISNPVTVNTAGSVSFVTGYNMGVGGSFTYVAGTFVQTQNTFSILGNCTLSTGTNCPFGTLTVVGTTCSITLLNDISLPGIVANGTLRIIQNSGSVPSVVTFTGAHNISCYQLSMQSSQMSMDAGQALTVTGILGVQGAPSSFTETGMGCTILSNTPGQRIHLVYTGGIYQNRVQGYNNFTDVDATGSLNPIWAFFANGSVVSNCLNFYTGLYTNPTSVPRDLIIQ